MLKRILTPLSLLIFLIAAASAPAQQPKYCEMVLITTNDLHANLLPFNYDAKLQDKLPGIKDVGGAARRATYIKSLRAQSPDPVLLLDSGDTTFGTNNLAKKYHGARDVEVMNALGYIAMEPGNHDFQWHSPDTLRNLRTSQFPWICANLVDTKTGKLFLTPYIIRSINGVRVAFFGLMTQLVNKPNYPAVHELGLESRDPIEAAAKLVPELRKNADIVILLSHLGAKMDEELAKKVPGVDVILGGHSHTRLPHPVMVTTAPQTAFSLGEVPVVQAFCWGGEIGKTQVTFHRDPQTGHYTLMSCKGELIPINSSTPDDPEIARIVNRK